MMQIAISKRIYALLFAGAGISIIIIACLMSISFPGTGDRLRKTMLFITIIACITYISACLMLIIISESRDKFKILSQINQNVIESQQQYYMLVNEKQQEIRSIRHEMKNHYSCIKGLYKANKLQDMEQYINQLVEDSEQSEDLIDTGNDIVNAIINDAMSRYQAQRIKIHLEGAFPDKLYVTAMDLCVIFANLISNAVEAILQMERDLVSDSFVNVKISSFKDDLFIDVINPTSKNVEIQNGTMVTSKKDKSNHGFGTKNIKQRIEKYKGTVEFKNENNCFLVEISMKNKNFE